MAFTDFINSMARHMNITLTDDVVPMVEYVFSNTGTISPVLADVLNKKARGLTGEKANEARLKYIINDILERANYAARDGKFNFVDAYCIWLVIVNDDDYQQYLRHDVIELPSASVYRIEGINKIQYPAYSGIIYGYLKLVEPESRDTVEGYLNNHFNNSPIQVLNLTNVYNELIRITSP